ncbi:hypothetical protein [Sphingomonas sp. ERG5]|uniref:hypothetical protein n=1 Tax=Sphingomonas sp. ERG5 TaxID=1381597 RepID=UPI000A8871A8|nr:hypothetical protein [Sphingomonas sp. ERG5]
MTNTTLTFLVIPDVPGTFAAAGLAMIVKIDAPTFFPPAEEALGAGLNRRQMENAAI